jgi:hypothetical protein
MEIIAPRLELLEEGFARAHPGFLRSPVARPAAKLPKRAADTDLDAKRQRLPAGNLIRMACCPFQRGLRRTDAGLSLLQRLRQKAPMILMMRLLGPEFSLLPLQGRKRAGRVEE